MGDSVVPGQGWNSVVVGAKLTEAEAELGPATVDDDGESAIWGSLGIFVGLKNGEITSVYGYLTDPFDWIFAGALTPFAGELAGFVAGATPTDLVAARGEPQGTEDSKQWTVVSYEGISFTFFEGQLSSWTVGDDDEDDADDDDDEFDL